MNKLKKVFKRLWQDESGQGATEYILMIVVVVALVFIFRNNIQDYIKRATEEAGGKIEGAVQGLSNPG